MLVVRLMLCTMMEQSHLGLQSPNIEEWKAGFQPFMFLLFTILSGMFFTFLGLKTDGFGSQCTTTGYALLVAPQVFAGILSPGLDPKKRKNDNLMK